MVYLSGLRVRGVVACQLTRRHPTKLVETWRHLKELKFFISDSAIISNQGACESLSSWTQAPSICPEVKEVSFSWTLEVDTLTAHSVHRRRCKETYIMSQILLRCFQESGWGVDSQIENLFGKPKFNTVVNDSWDCIFGELNFIAVLIEY